MSTPSDTARETRGLPENEIVVTRAMIEAGANELAWYDSETESPKEYMVAVYRAMHRARET